MGDHSGPKRHSAGESIYDDPALFIDRDFSLIEFQRRVFEEARDENNPLLERLNFLSIVVSNFDEFEMIRMPQLAQWGGQDEDLETAPAEAEKHFERLRTEIVQCMRDVRGYLSGSLIPALAREGIRLLQYS